MSSRSPTKSQHAIKRQPSDDWEMINALEPSITIKPGELVALESLLGIGLDDILQRVRQEQDLVFSSRRQMIDADI